MENSSKKATSRKAAGVGTALGIVTRCQDWKGTEIGIQLWHNSKQWDGQAPASCGSQAAQDEAEEWVSNKHESQYIK